LRAQLTINAKGMRWLMARRVQIRRPKIAFVANAAKGIEDQH
jgi:hypothetical protein